MRTAKTVCGLRVAMIIEPGPVSAALHLVSTAPHGYTTCSHCQRITSGIEVPIQSKPDARPTTRLAADESA